MYFGRIQQGGEISLVLQTTDAEGTPADPEDVPWVEIYLDAATPELVDSRRMPADLRGVAVGVFRLPVFLDTLYSTEGRYLVVFKWTDSDGVPHTSHGAFHLLPGGSPDGHVIAMHVSNRADAGYVIRQCDSGRLVRGRNPR